MTLCPVDLDLPARFASYRPRQLQTSLDIAANAHRFSLLQAGTGSGKTLIAATVHRLCNGRTLQLTGTRALQSQAFNDFNESGLTLIQGAANYRCLDSRRRGTCERGDDLHCAYRRHDSTRLCTQLAAQQAARNSDWVIGNYATWFAVGRYTPDALGTFTTLWLDEAHSALEWLADACAMTFTTSELADIGVDAPPEGELDVAWAGSAIDAAVSAYRHARDKGASPQTLATLTELGKRLRELANAATSADVTDAWVGETVRGGWRFVPVWPSKYAESRLWRGIERVVLSSATLTHEDAKHLGLSRANDEYSFHELDAGFSPARHPLYYQPVARVDKDMGAGEWRLCMNEWDRFITPRLRLGRRGVVQATSYDYARRFVSGDGASKHSEQCALHDRNNSRDVVARWMRGDGPPILVSPAVKEGHDFANDVARWQVIIKVPSPNTLSPVVRARCRSDKMYRNHLTGRDLEQRCGRVMRSHSDFGECLIVDEHFGWLRGKPVFTQSFRRTWQTVSSTPKPLEVA